MYDVPPGNHWKLTVRDRLEFEKYFRSLSKDDQYDLDYKLQHTPEFPDPELYCVNKTKHLWVVYQKWYYEEAYQALFLEEDLGELSLDSDSDDDEDAQPPPPAPVPAAPLVAFTNCSEDQCRDEEPSETDEQDEEDDALVGSASPEPQVTSPSPDLRAPSVGITPATSTTPAAPKAPKRRRAAVSTDGPPPKRRKDLSKAAPRLKRSQARPRARKSKVARKPRVQEEDERPEHNPHHESYLYSHFHRPPPTDRKTRAIFALDSFKLLNKSTKALVSLLSIQSGASNDKLRLKGRACTLSDEEGAEFEAAERATSDPSKDEQDGMRKVLIAGHDIVGLTLSLDGMYLETRQARYLLRQPSTDYEQLAAIAQRLHALYLVGRENFVLGQNRKGSDLVLKSLNDAIAKAGREPSTLEAALHWSWQTEGLLSPLQATNVDKEIAGILYEQLPNTPYVTRFVYDLVVRHLFPGMIRTDFGYDPSIGEQQRAADEALLQAAQEEVLKFEAGAVPTVKLPKSTQGTKLIDSKSILNAEEPRTAITVFKEALIAGVLYRAGDTVLVMGESPRRAAQGQSLSKEKKSTCEDDDEEGVQDGDVDAAIEKELRQERATKSSTLSDVTAPWFARIGYFFYKDKGKDKHHLYVHLDWFHHLRATPLGAVAHARALVYADQCDSISADGIIRKVEVKRVNPEETIPDEGFYFGFFWNKETGAYEDVDTLDDPDLVDWTLGDAAQLPRCVSCARRLVEGAVSVEDLEPSKAEQDARISVPVWVSPEKSCAFIYEDLTYHLGDLVYITPAYTFTVKSDPHRQPFLLAQLIGIDNITDPSSTSSTLLTERSKLQVRWLFRHDDLFEHSGAKDPHRLVATNLTGDVDVKSLKGKAVLFLESEVVELATDRLTASDEATPELCLALGQALLSPDEFWGTDELVVDDDKLLRIGLNESGEPPKKRLKESQGALKRIPKDDAPLTLPRCKICLEERRIVRKKEQQAKELADRDPSQRLDALSLYSGADLFGLGLEHGCSILNVKYAVELERDVAKACQANRPQTTAYAAAVSDFLEAAVQKGKVPTAVGGTAPPPKKDNVDFILAGAPCQGFSSVNKFKKIDDIRCCEPWVYLSAMDWWRPAFSSFENVRDIQHFALPIDAEKGDLLNILIDALMRLGYQVRPDVYNAASFGTPQVRRRLILTVARRGLPLPASPKATHAYSTALTGMAPTTYDGGVRTHVVKDCHRPHGHAPHPAVTFAEATSDLPAFGFADPYGTGLAKIGPSQQQWEAGQPIGFAQSEKRAYEHPLPQTAYQRASRFNVRNTKIDPEHDVSAIVLDHVVPPVSEQRASLLAHLGVSGESRGKGNYEGTFYTLEM
ncbi:hypothetical protein BCR35DRAFT_116324 [Leucosporidium creatinivorum]|uniref:DNA (cytosine-5-)-methyltransferase n=1 Tax=Leucosporidium creatinivorum TaxID=106004 RepID=A0A1Y2F2P9_9BASI|nr:hypothetical protein BCR35DRAFT_116324 [Leucosporidium creatinivorum]